MIYFVTDGEYLKIGYTDNDVESRISALQIGNARKLKLIGVIDGNRDDEATLHYVFRGLRVSGEWFSCGFFDENDSVDKLKESNVVKSYQPASPAICPNLQIHSTSPSEWTNYHNPLWKEVDVSDFTRTRKLVIRTIMENPYMSNSEISRQCDVSRPTVIATKRALIEKLQRNIDADSSDEADCPEEI